MSQRPVTGDIGQGGNVRARTKAYMAKLDARSGASNNRTPKHKEMPTGPVVIRKKALEPSSKARKAAHPSKPKVPPLDLTRSAYEPNRGGFGVKSELHVVPHPSEYSNSDSGNGSSASGSSAPPTPDTRRSTGKASTPYGSKVSFNARKPKTPEEKEAYVKSMTVLTRVCDAMDTFSRAHHLETALDESSSGSRAMSPKKAKPETRPKSKPRTGVPVKSEAKPGPKVTMQPLNELAKNLKAVIEESVSDVEEKPEASASGVVAKKRVGSSFQTETAAHEDTTNLVMRAIGSMTADAEITGITVDHLFNKLKDQGYLGGFDSDDKLLMIHQLAFHIQREHQQLSDAKKQLLELAEALISSLDSDIGFAGMSHRGDRATGSVPAINVQEGLRELLKGNVAQDLLAAEDRADVQVMRRLILLIRQEVQRIDERLAKIGKGQLVNKPQGLKGLSPEETRAAINRATSDAPVVARRSKGEVTIKDPETYSGKMNFHWHAHKKYGQEVDHRKLEVSGTHVQMELNKRKIALDKDIKQKTSTTEFTELPKEMKKVLNDPEYKGKKMPLHLWKVAYINKLNDGVEADKAALQEMEAELRATSDRIAESRTELTAAYEDMEAAHKPFKDITGLPADYDADMAKLASLKDAIERDRAEYERLLGEMPSAVETTPAGFDSDVQALQQLETELDELKAKVDTRKRELAPQLEELKANIERFNEEASGLAENCDDIRTEYDAAKAEYDRLLGVYNADDTKANYEAVQSQLKAVNDRLEALEEAERHFAEAIHKRNEATLQEQAIVDVNNEAATNYEKKRAEYNALKSKVSTSVPKLESDPRLEAKKKALERTKRGLDAKIKEADELKLKISNSLHSFLGRTSLREAGVTDVSTFVKKYEEFQQKRDAYLKLAKEKALSEADRKAYEAQIKLYKKAYSEYNDNYRAHKKEYEDYRDDVADLVRRSEFSVECTKKMHKRFDAEGKEERDLKNAFTFSEAEIRALDMSQLKRPLESHKLQKFEAGKVPDLMNLSLSLPEFEAPALAEYHPTAAPVVLPQFKDYPKVDDDVRTPIDDINHTREDLHPLESGDIPAPKPRVSEMETMTEPKPMMVSTGTEPDTKPVMTSTGTQAGKRPTLSFSEATHFDFAPTPPATAEAAVGTMPPITSDMETQTDPLPEPAPVVKGEVRYVYVQKPTLVTPLRVADEPTVHEARLVTVGKPDITKPTRKVSHATTATGDTPPSGEPVDVSGPGRKRVKNTHNLTIKIKEDKPIDPKPDPIKVKPKNPIRNIVNHHDHHLDVTIRDKSRLSGNVIPILNQYKQLFSAILGAYTSRGSAMNTSVRKLFEEKAEGDFYDHTQLQDRFEDVMWEIEDAITGYDSDNDLNRLFSVFQSLGELRSEMVSPGGFYDIIKTQIPPTTDKGLVRFLFGNGKLDSEKYGVYMKMESKVSDRSDEKVEEEGEEFEVDPGTTEEEIKRLAAEREDAARAAEEAKKRDARAGIQAAREESERGRRASDIAAAKAKPSVVPAPKKNYGDMSYDELMAALGLDSEDEEEGDAVPAIPARGVAPVVDEEEDLGLASGGTGTGRVAEDEDTAHADDVRRRTEEAQMKQLRERQKALREAEARARAGRRVTSEAADAAQREATVGVSDSEDEEEAARLEDLAARFKERKSQEAWSSRRVMSDAGELRMPAAPSRPIRVEEETGATGSGGRRRNRSVLGSTLRNLAAGAADVLTKL